MYNIFRNVIKKIQWIIISKNSALLQEMYTYTPRATHYIDPVAREWLEQ